jgi:hypothetical protein
MAIIKSTGETPQNKVVDGMSYQNQNGYTAFQAANNNRNSKSNNFRNLDSLIMQLDARYDALPTHVPWDIYAENIDGDWDLCASCAPEGTGKKLYRQYNYNRLLLGKEIVSLPSNVTETSPSPAATMVFVYTNGSLTSFEIGNTSNGSPCYALANIGLAMNNPFIKDDWPEGVTQFSFTSPEFIWASKLPRPADVPMCFFSENGAPGRSALWSTVELR